MGIKLLGLAASPRHGNCELIIKEALEGAAESKGVSTTFLTIAHKRVDPCLGVCHRRCHPPVEDYLCGRGERRGWFQCVHKDDAPSIIEAIAQADAIIIASPVFFGQIPAQLKSLIDRCNSVNYFQGEESFSWFRYKVGGAIAIGGARHGGQEETLRQIVHFYMSMQMIPVGFAEREAPYGLAFLAEQRRKVERDTWLDWGFRQASAPEYARLFGRKVAEVATIVQRGLSASANFETVR
ncbi:MAG: flavodoxin family protein [Chloroflexi bacterium]|nr:flavodoxin family protein [Chloroflexota bacterium]